MMHYPIQNFLFIVCKGLIPFAGTGQRNALFLSAGKDTRKFIGTVSQTHERQRFHCGGLAVVGSK